MKNLDAAERRELLKQPYISANDIYKILPVGKNQCRRIFKEIEAELINQGVPMFNTTPKVIPTKYLINKYCK